MIAERIKPWQAWLSLVLSIASFFSAVLIPVFKYFASPEPFITYAHFEGIALPDGLSNSSESRSSTSDRSPATGVAGRGLDQFIDHSTDLLSVTVQNNGPTARRDVSIRISGVKQFGGVGLKSRPSLIPEISKWREPIFKDDNVLEFPPLPEFPANSVITISVWAQFDQLFRSLEVRSAEGIAAVQEGESVFGWRLLLIPNVWWIVVLISLALGFVFMRRFERLRVR